MPSEPSVPEIAILHEDPHLLVVAKPAGLSTTPDRWDRARPDVRSVLEPAWGRLWLVHRLDAGTSGILVLAREAGAHRALSRLFQHRRVTKIYHAVVEGCPDPPRATIRLPLAPDARRPGKTRIASAGGTKAKTSYLLMERFERFSLLEIRLLTGRTHQARVHLSAIGHPLAVDRDYGNRERLTVADLGRRSDGDRVLMTRPPLHARHVAFRHPVSGKPIEITAPYPADFEDLLSALRSTAAERGEA